MLSDDTGDRGGHADRETSRASYSALYSEVRMLSLIPPSTLT